MSDIVLFYMPGAVSRMVMTALEQAGVEYKAVKADPTMRETAEFKAINPQGKVPALIWDGRSLSESSAMVWFLYTQFPDAGFIPAGKDALEGSRMLADIIWASNSLHALVARYYKPERYTTGGDTDGIREDAAKKIGEEFANITARVGDKWWYGDEPSIMDAYLAWTVYVAEFCGFDIAPYPDILAYVKRVSEDYPAYKRAIEREAAN